MFLRRTLRDCNRQRKLAVSLACVHVMNECMYDACSKWQSKGALKSIIRIREGMAMFRNPGKAGDFFHLAAHCQHRC